MSSSASPLASQMNEMSIGSGSSDNYGPPSNITTPAYTRPTTPEPKLPASPLKSGKHKICVIGSGSWGSALAKIAAENAWRRKDEFHSEVRMWVREKHVSSDSPEEATHIVKGIKLQR